MIRYYSARCLLRYRLPALFCAVALLCGCAAQTKPETEESLLCRIAGWSAQSTVAQVEGQEVSARLYLFWLGYSCRYWDRYVYRQSGAHIDWDATLSGALSYADFARSEAWRLVQLQLLTEQWAETYGAELSSMQQTRLAEERTAHVARCGDEDAFHLMLRKQGADEALYHRICCLPLLYASLTALAQTPDSALYAPEETLRRFAREQGYLSLDILLLNTRDRDSGALLGEQIEAQVQAQAQALLYQLKQSLHPEELFSQFADLYSQDPYRPQHPDGYLYTAETLPEEFSAAAALKEGEFSPLLTMPYGVALLCRKSTYPASLREEYFSSSFAAALSHLSCRQDPRIGRLDVGRFFRLLPQIDTKAQGGSPYEYL